MPTSSAGIARGQQLLRGARTGQRLRERGGGEHRKRDGAGQRVRGLMQRSGEEARRERGQQPEDRKRDPGADRGGEEPTA